MLAGLTIAVLSERGRLVGHGRAVFWLTALLLALAVRWLTFLNSTTLQLSWAAEADPYAIVGPWVGWWGLWASFGMAWTFVASARCWDTVRAWRLPLAVLALVLTLRIGEDLVIAAGFALVLPWGTQALTEPFVPIMSDFGLALTTLPLILPTLGMALVARWGARWSARSFGAVTGLGWGLLLGLQFVVLRTVLLRDMLQQASFWSAPHLQALAAALVAGLVGGLIGAYQGDWLRSLRSEASSPAVATPAVAAQTA